MKLDLPRLMLAAPSSGGGKTTVTCGLLQLFQNMDMEPAAFKCGPDFIDPLFHKNIVGAKSGNLDLFFTKEATVRALLAKGGKGCGIALMEGVMGYYDGVAADSTAGSSYHLAKATNTPVILVLDVHGAALSLAAQIYGFALFRPDANIKGVILNKCTKALFEYLAPALEKNTRLPVLGYVPTDERYAVESRHLGLVTANEIDGLKTKILRLAQTLSETVDIEALLDIAGSAPPLQYTPYAVQQKVLHRPRLAVARDKAFCFYYEENLHMLENMGTELVEFSPLEDKVLPEDIHGIYLGGGYPELHAKQLAANWEMRASIRSAIENGTPTVAECGGFLYLLQSLDDDKGQEWPMLGVLEGIGENLGKLQRFGYITLTAEKDNLYCKAGESIRGHEFHYWQATVEGEDFAAQKPRRNLSWPSMVATDTLVAGFPHIYYPANPDFAASFVRAMAAYKGANP